jgi:2-polyprenyl-6-hydroxyphenyl methylase/3-demethylubiquinone-9 3-methyltransferase
MRQAAEDGTNGRRRSVDAEEVARFAALAEEWWDADGAMRPLHLLNAARIAFIRDRVAAHFRRAALGERPLRDLELLDIGCGGGLLAEPMRRLGARVTGIDAAEKAVQVARRHAGEAGLDIDYAQAVPEDLADAGRRFDVVLGMEVLEHVADRDHFLSVSCDLVAPGGAMVVATLNRTLKALAMAKIGAEYVLRWLPVGTHDWRKFVRPSELAAGLRRHGFDVVALEGLSYDGLAGVWDRSPDLGVNYMAFAVRSE